MSIHEQARAEAKKAFHAIFDDAADDLTYPRSALREFKRGTYARRFLAGHEAATRTRVVTTVAELDALPIGSVVLNANGVAFVKAWYDDGGGLQMDRWHATGFEGRWVSEAVIGGGVTSPARVLYDPEEN